MRDELAEDRPAGRLVAKRAGRIGGIAAVTETTSAAERVKKGLVGFERGHFRKHARISGRTDRSINRRAKPRRGQAMRSEGRCDVGHETSGPTILAAEGADE